MREKELKKIENKVTHLVMIMPLRELNTEFGLLLEEVTGDIKKLVDETRKKNKRKKNKRTKEQS